MSELYIPDIVLVTDGHRGEVDAGIIYYIQVDFLLVRAVLLSAVRDDIDKTRADSCYNQHPN